MGRYLGSRSIVRPSALGLLAVSTSIVYLLVLLYTENPSALWLPGPSSARSHGVVTVKTRGEDVSWAYDLQPAWTPFIYPADPEPEFSLQLPANRGREAMAYLTYIVDYYDTLPEVIAFVHGDNYQWHNNIPGSNNSEVLSFLRIDTVKSKGYVNLRCDLDPGCPIAINPFEPTNTDIKNHDIRAYFIDVYMELFNVTREHVPPHIGGVCCAQFALTGERIRQRPREDYERMRNWALTTDLDSFGIGWVFEKIWHLVFLEDAIFCPPAEACQCELFGICEMEP